MNPVHFDPVAVVHNSRQSTADFAWGPVESVIEMLPGFAEGLEGIDTFSHVIVIFHLDREDDEESPTLRRRPRGRADMPLLGVFAQRGRMRPNRIGITTVPIVRVEPNRLTVRGLDAIDGTPVLDLKPYMPAFDHIETPRVPAWVDRLMKGYFDEE